ncbi:hypothetical protein BV25DRAFT_1819632 [Artomyces pyxidatus]|uniref:Uncharacterized protein n=1 Tax=Artomyces pyxidatus TaxID=48021 RepID=A0ACB8TFV2_9AGAM|nr:hypothetical protein BV25DRAFT_1819632 [Artomyces pyxidatus]
MQHPSPAVNPHDHSSRIDSSYGQSAIPAHMQQQQQQPGPIGAGPPPRDLEPAQKRPRSTAAVVGVSPRSSHNGYSQHQPSYASPPTPQSSYLLQPAAPHEPIQHHQGNFAPPQPPQAYQNYPPYMAQRPPPPQPQHQHQPPPHGNPYPPPQPPSHSTDHWQPQHPVQHPQQPPQPGVAYSKPAALVPTAVDSRGMNNARPDMEKVNQRQGTMAEILKHCNVLYSFANRYAQMQASRPDAQPSTAELTEMGQHASQVVRLLEDLRRLSLSEHELAKDSVAPVPEDHRPPKRPWEDMTSETTPEASTSLAEAQSTAEADMALIRTKRATTSGQNGGPGQPKSKYRKRSRATPPGKCHSCNIRETPEWRRGPDGARTLCNACGLHYAKLMRKRDKAGGPDGKGPAIDLETLRASTRMAEANGTLPGGPNDANGTDNAMNPPNSAHSEPHPSPALTKASSLSSPLSPQGQGQYGLVPITNQGPGVPPHHNQQQQMMPPPPPPQHEQAPGQQHQGSAPPPPPPWAQQQQQQQQQNGRGYSGEHQSFMRSHRGSSQYSS